MPPPKPSLLTLPNEVLVEIAKNFRNVRDLDNLSTTCQRLSAIGDCPELTVRDTIDNAEHLTRELATKYLKQDTKILRLNFGSRGAFRATVKGLANLVGGSICDKIQQWTTCSLYIDQLKLLDELFPGLQELELVNCYIPGKIDVTDFPKSLTKLVLVECILGDPSSHISRYTPDDWEEGGFLSNLVKNWQTAMPKLKLISFVRCHDDMGCRYAVELGSQVYRWQRLHAGNWISIDAENRPEHKIVVKTIHNVSVFQVRLKDFESCQLAEVANVHVRFQGSLFVTHEVPAGTVNIRERWISKLTRRCILCVRLLLFLSCFNFALPYLIGYFLYCKDFLECTFCSVLALFQLF